MIQPNQQNTAQLNENLNDKENDKEQLNDNQLNDNELKETNNLNGELNNKQEFSSKNGTEETDDSISMEPNQILDIKKCKERIEKIFQKIDKVSANPLKVILLIKTYKLYKVFLKKKSSFSLRTQSHLNNFYNYQKKILNW